MTSQGSESEVAWDSDHLRRRLQAMDDFNFEHLVADLWVEQGWDTEVEQQSGDAGIDVRATKSSPYNKKVLIQAKRYSDDNPLGGPDIQQYSALKQQESGTDEAIIVTTGRFTGSAENRAEDLNVKLIDGYDLLSIIDTLDAYDLVESYVGPPQTVSREESTSEIAEAEIERQHREPDKERLVTLVDDLEAFQEQEQHRIIRSEERAKGRVQLNPHDAKLLGIFDDLPIEANEVERNFNQKKEALSVYREDIHIGSSGLYVEDITDYITAEAVDGHEIGPVIGEIERGISDEAWVAPNGQSEWKKHKHQRQGKQKLEEVFEEVMEWLDRKTQELSEPNDKANQSSSPSELEHSTTTSENHTDRGAPSNNELDLEKINSSYSNWFKVTIAGTVGWFLAFIMAGSIPNFILTDVTILLSWVILPIGIYMDASRSGIARNHSTKLYLIGALIPIIAMVSGVVYLYKRKTSWS